jgi:DNA-binding CsgD family transcriptional regulator
MEFDGASNVSTVAMRELVDRVGERASLDDILEATASGLSGTCVLVGDAGMGKTRLLEYAMQRAQAFRHLVISGVEAEVDLAYAALHRLSRPLLAYLDQLPIPQRRAIASAFGLEGGEPPDRFLVGMGCLSLLAAAATERKLLCVIDDAQWIDRESLEALSFVARRLEADGVALLFGIRDLAMVTGALDGVPTLSVGGLPDDAAIALLASSVDMPVEPDTARRIVESTSGCPLALIELASGLTHEQLRGGQPVGTSLPIGRRLEDHFLEQVRDLDANAQLFLLVAAAESSGDPALVRRAAFELGSDAHAEDAAIASGLIALRPRVEFRHPLIRAAVYGGAPRALRDEVHRTLATILDRADPDRRVRHLAAAAREPDATLALELEQAGVRASRRGGYAAEASFLLEAAQLSPASEDRARRLLGAATASLHGGMPQRAETLLEQAFPDLHDPLLRAEAMLLDGTLRTPLADPPSAPARLVGAAEALAPFDLDLAREAFLEALTACTTAQRFTVGTTTEDVARAALTTIKHSTAEDTLAAALLEGTARLFTSDYAAAMPILHKAMAALRAGDVTRHELSRWYNIVLTLTNDLTDDETYNSWVAFAEQQARADGALIVLQVVLLARAKAELRAGRFTVAEMTFDEVVDITGVIGGLPEFYEMLKCELYAWRGQEREARASAAPLREAAAAIGSAAAVMIADLAVATMELGAGRYADALRAVEPMADDNLPGWTCLALPIAVEAAVRSGDVERASGYLSKVRAHTTASDTTWARGQLARCAALLADDSEAEALHLDAIRLLESTSVITEAWQAKLAYGEWLRRQNRRVDARAQLRGAYDWFSEIGAEGFAARARAELEATGEHVSSRSVETRTDLTPQEAQAARLAASGATNAEIATQMYISANTVDYHLRKVYRKLGVSSRRELRNAVPAMDG